MQGVWVEAEEDADEGVAVDLLTPIQVVGKDVFLGHAQLVEDWQVYLEFSEDKDAHADLHEVPLPNMCTIPTLHAMLSSGRLEVSTLSFPSLVCILTCNCTDFRQSDDGNYADGCMGIFWKALVLPNSTLAFAGSDAVYLLVCAAAQSCQAAASSNRSTKSSADVF